MDPPVPPPWEPPPVPLPPPPSDPGWQQSLPGAPAARTGGPRRPLLAALVVVALLAGAVVGILVVGHRDSPAPAAARGTPTGGSLSTPSPVPGSVAFMDPDGYFRATFTGKPVKELQSVPVSGTPLPLTQWINVGDTTNTEIIGYATYPADLSITSPYSVLDGTVSGEVGSSNGKVVSKTLGTTLSFPSVDAVISISAGFIESRAILAGHTIFVVLATSADNPPPLFEALAGSFAILKHAP